MALALAEKALGKDANDQNMLIIAANAACQVKNADKAKSYITRLRGHPHDTAVVVCARNGVDIGRPPPAHELTEEQKKDATDRMQRAVEAKKRQAWKEVLADAQAVLKVAPMWPNALPTAFEAACKLHDERTAKALLPRFVFPRVRDNKKKECLRDGVALP